MLNRFVANWLREQAQDAVLRGLQPSPADSRESEQPAAESSSVDIALFFPTASQAAGLVDQLKGVKVSECHGFVERVGQMENRRVAVIETQLSNQPLAMVVRDAICLRQPRWVLATGFATSMQSQVAPGHLLVANRLVDTRGYSLGINTGMPSAMSLHVGALLTVSEEPHAAKTATTTTAEADTTNSALAWETQAAVIGEVCRVLKTKMMAVHGVSGRSDRSESKLTQEIKSQDSLAGILGAAAGALIEKPSSFKDLWNEKEATLVISDRLAKFLVGVMVQLPVD